MIVVNNIRRSMPVLYSVDGTSLFAHYEAIFGYTEVRCSYLCITSSKTAYFYLAKRQKVRKRNGWKHVGGWMRYFAWGHGV